MQTLTESLIEQGLNNRVLSERQLERAVGGEAARRYGLVNRALKANEARPRCASTREAYKVAESENA